MNNCGCNEDNLNNGCNCGGDDCGCGTHEHEHDHGCGCGCGDSHEHNEDYHVITLELEDGREEICNVIGVFDVDEEEYIALLNTDDNVYLYKYAEIDAENIDIQNIEDDEEFEAVSKAFFDLFEEVDEDEE